MCVDWVRGLIRVSVGFVGQFVCRVNSCVNWVRGLIRVSIGFVG